MVSLFIAPSAEQIRATRDLGVPAIELHTGAYARAFADRAGQKEFQKLKLMCALAQKIGLSVNAGHGLNYDNVLPVARIAGMQELNIGHAIISRAVFVGLAQAVKEMKHLVKI